MLCLLSITPSPQPLSPSTQVTLTLHKSKLSLVSYWLLQWERYQSCAEDYESGSEVKLEIRVSEMYANKKQISAGGDQWDCWNVGRCILSGVMFTFRRHAEINAEKMEGNLVEDYCIDISKNNCWPFPTDFIGVKNQAIFTVTLDLNCILTARPKSKQWLLHCNVGAE